MFPVEPANNTGAAGPSLLQRELHVELQRSVGALRPQEPLLRQRQWDDYANMD